jgi:hypothetical protein
MFVPLRCSCRLGLAAVVRPGSSILAQWRGLTSRVGGCRGRPVRMLRRNSTLSIIKMEISWKPENLRAYADGSYSEKLSLLIGYQKIEMLHFSGYILGGARRVYIPVSFPLPGALILPHKTAVPLFSETSSQQNQHGEKRHSTCTVHESTLCFSPSSLCSHSCPSTTPK